MEKTSIFETLNKINVNGKTEKKNGLTYLSWAWAWGEVKKAFPGTTYTIYERPTEYGPVNYFTDGRTCWVKTGITIDGLEYIEELPVMDFRNNAIPLDKVTSTDVNKAIQRSLTKAVARHGLGLYIYAGEDLPEEEAAAAAQEKPAQKPSSLAARAQKAAAVTKTEVPAAVCEDCGQPISAVSVNGKSYEAASIMQRSRQAFGKCLCWQCSLKRKQGAA